MSFSKKVCSVKTLIKKIRSRVTLSTVLMLSLTLLLAVTTRSALFAYFDNDVGETASVRLSFDVTGTAVLVPFVVMPTGQMINLSPEVVTNTTDYTFPDIDFPDPHSGTYMVGAFVHGVTDCAVYLNRSSTSMRNSKYTIVLRKTNAEAYSVAPTAGDYTFIMAPVIYAQTFNPVP